MYMMYVCMQDDGPLKITIYHVTWLPSRNKAFTYLLTYITISREINHIMCVYLGWISLDLPTTSHVIDVLCSTDAYISLGFSQYLYASTASCSAHAHTYKIKTKN